MPDPLKGSNEIRFKMGEIYNDILVVDAFQRGLSVSGHAGNLLGSKMMEREPLVVRRNAYLAWKRGISASKLWMDTLTGEAEPISTEEMKALREQGLIDEDGDVPGLRTE